MNERVFHHSQAAKLEDPERLVWMPPGEILAPLHLQPGMTVADIGAGTGYFALPMAAAVAPEGVVLAVDLQPEMLARIEAKLAVADAPRNLRLSPGTASATGLPEHVCDVAFLGNLWHELEDAPAVLAEMKRILRPGGTLAILDWHPEEAAPPGPPQKHRIAPEQVCATLEDAGWRLQLAERAGVYSYLVLATPNLP